MARIIQFPENLKAIIKLNKYRMKFYKSKMKFNPGYICILNRVSYNVWRAQQMFSNIKQKLTHCKLTYYISTKYKRILFDKYNEVTFWGYLIIAGLYKNINSKCIRLVKTPFENIVAIELEILNNISLSEISESIDIEFNKLNYKEQERIYL